MRGWGHDIDSEMNLIFAYKNLVRTGFLSFDSDFDFAILFIQIMYG